jgi:diguanylate cyclase (GGDEF)-like protein/PAS domain S-box-containing protein
VPEPGATPGLAEVAREWAATLADTKGVSLTPEELEGILLQVARAAVEHAPSERDSTRDSALERFTGLYSLSPLGIALADHDGEIFEANPALIKLLGFPAEELRGRNISDLGAEGRDAMTLRSGLNELRDGKTERYQEKVKLDHAEDGQIWVEITLAHLPGDTSGSAYPVLMVSDVNELHLLRERLLHQNITDALTGLPNGSQFATHLETALGSRSQEQIALIYLDIDGFKVINDGLGAGTGDKVLRGVARKLSAVFSRKYDGFVARLSGDGFAILMRGNLGAGDVIELVDQAFEDLAEPIYLDGYGIGVSASAGIVVRGIAEGSRMDLLRGAEIALHRAKEAGKAQWKLFEPELDAADRARYQLGAVIAGALENGEFSLIYQPTVKLSKPDELAAVNAGLRWNHPDNGDLDSDEFYPLAATTGMTGPLGKWLLAESLAATARWRDRFGDSAPDVCVRLPARLAIDPDLVLMVKKELDRNDLPAKALRICTDRESILDPRGEVLDSLTTLAGLGTQLVLTITGTSDLELIPTHELPVRHVILSGPVVDAIADSEDEPAMRHLTQLITRAKELQLRVGAEGVRTHAQAARLRKLGVLAARGAFVSDSATGDEVDDLIERHAR